MSCGFTRNLDISVFKADIQVSGQQQTVFTFGSQDSEADPAKVFLQFTTTEYACLEPQCLRQRLQNPLLEIDI